MGPADWSAKILDAKRLAALSAARLVDTEAEEVFDGLTRLSVELLRAPVALVSLVDARRQFFKSAIGLGEPWASRRETPLSHSFCKYVVATGEPLIVEDARLSPLLRENPAIKELGVIAYAGVPLKAAGEAIGAFCVIEQKPRLWSDAEVRLLRELGRAVEAQIALRLAHVALHERERMLGAVLDTMPAGFALRNVEGAVVRTNPALQKMLGLTESELLQTDFWAITHPDDVARDVASRREILAGKREITTRFKRFRHADGHYLWVRLSAAALRDADGIVQGTVAVVDDVTEEREQASAMRRAKALFEATLANIHDGVVVLDADYNVVLANRAYCDLLGLDPDTIIGSTRAQFLAHAVTLAQDPEAFLRSIEQPSAGALGATAEIVLVRPRRRTMRRTIAPIELPDGPGHLVVWKDTTAETALLEERERLALTDALTGIPNRRAAEQALVTAIARAERAHTPLSVAFFDIDLFKRVNDRHGHATGDEVLRRVASALDAAKRLTDTVARWGGEEFVAVLPVPLEGAKAFCERVREAVAELACPGVGQVTISAGVASLIEEEGHERLLARADERLYAAKSAGRNRVEA